MPAIPVDSGIAADGHLIAVGHIDIVTHDASFDDALNLPRCYRVKAVVSMDATR